MMKAGISEDDECWNIAESIVEEIELMREESSGELSAESWPKIDFKGLFIKRIRALGP